jgi:hypothetical protein
VSALPRLIPDPSRLFVEGGGRFIAHHVLLREFPVEHRHVVREVYDALVDLDRLNLTMLPDSITDLVLHGLSGLCLRSVQEGLYYLEIGPRACHLLLSLERGIRQTAAELEGLAGIAEPTDGDLARIAELTARRDRLGAELTVERAARRELKDALGKVTGSLEPLLRRREPTDLERAQIAELSAEAARLRGELIREDSVIFRHSGPGFHGLRNIELLAQLAKAKPKSKAKGDAEAGGDGPKKGKGEPVYNRVPPPTPATPAELAAIKAATDAVVNGPEGEATEAERAAAEQFRARGEAVKAKAKARPEVKLDDRPRDPHAPARSVQEVLEAKRRALGLSVAPDPPDDS